MEINGVSGANEQNAFSQAVGDNTLGKDAFLELLVTQLENQDPLNPTSNEQMISQLAEFSALEEAQNLNEQMQSLNESILGLAVLQQSNALLAQLTDSSALIGRTVSYLDPADGSSATGEVESVKITDEGGAVLSIGGADIPLASILEVHSDDFDPNEGGAGDSVDQSDSANDEQ